MKKFLKKFFLSIMLAIVTLCSVTMASCFDNKLYEMMDISKYGDFYKSKYTTYYKKRSLVEDMNIIMPEKIESFFEVVKYSYRMQHTPEWYEAYLEVVIEDENEYQSYVQNLLVDKQTVPFFYDNSFEEYVWNDKISVSRDVDLMFGARIQKILISDAKNVIIFESLIALNQTSCSRTRHIYYFERFNIEPINYYDGDPEKLRLCD